MIYNYSCSEVCFVYVILRIQSCPSGKKVEKNMLAAHAPLAPRQLQELERVFINLKGRCHSVAKSIHADKLGPL